MESTEFQTRTEAIVRDKTLGYDQKLRSLAALATETLPYPNISDACAEALDKRVICDMFEGHAPYTARYILPDYEKAIHQGLAFLEMAPPTDLDDALSFLQIMYTYVPSVTSYPVYLGDRRSINLAIILHALAIGAALVAGSTAAMVITLATFPLAGYTFLYRTAAAS